MRITKPHDPECIQTFLCRNILYHFYWRWKTPCPLLGRYKSWTDSTDTVRKCNRLLSTIWRLWDRAETSLRVSSNGWDQNRSNRLWIWWEMFEIILKSAEILLCWQIWAQLETLAMFPSTYFYAHLTLDAGWKCQDVYEVLKMHIKNWYIFVSN